MSIMNNKIAKEIVDLVKNGNVDQALALVNGSPDKEASSYHRVLQDAISLAVDQATSAAIKVLHDKMIIANKDDLYETADDMRYMLTKWMKNYLKD